MSTRTGRSWTRATARSITRRCGSPPTAASSKCAAISASRCLAAAKSGIGCRTMRWERNRPPRAPRRGRNKLGLAAPSCGRRRRRLPLFPRHEYALSQGDEAPQQESEQRQAEQGDERHRCPQLAVRDDDEMAKPFVAPDKLSDHRADHGKGARNLQAAEQVGKRIWKPDFGELLPAPRVQNAAEIEQLLLDREQPGDHVHHNGE